MDDKKVYFHDTTFRDGVQALWAMYVNNGMWEAVGPYIDKAGFKSVDVLPLAPEWSVRWYQEQPWKREELIGGIMQNTPIILPTLGMMGNLSQYWPVAMLRFYIQFTQKLYKGKIKHAMLICPTRDELEREFHIMFPLMRAEGIEPVPYITYANREWLTDEYYAHLMKTLTDTYKPKMFVLEDVDGLLTVERAKTLLPVILKNAGNMPIVLHAHGMNTLHEAVAVEAMKQGIRHFQTCIPPLSNGSSHLNVFNVCHNARVLGLEPCIDEEPLRVASERLTRIADEEGLAKGAPQLYDESVYQTEVPGGVVATLAHQLTFMGMGDRYDEVMEEIPNIVKELGNPIMITPHSQYIVTQAAMNVAMGRWVEFPDTMIEYAMGVYGVGDTNLAGMDQNLKDKLLSDHRAKAIAENWSNYLERRETETLEEIKAKFGMEGGSDEDFFLRVRYISAAEQEAAKSFPPPKTYSFPNEAN
ncbi:MAG: hypothetical protein GY846_06980 [Deltaproteobacteria bacterium]|nr:hypothetical protein [Deltaproteobacteria bacterium]